MRPKTKQNKKLIHKKTATVTLHTTRVPKLFATATIMVIVYVSAPEVAVECTGFAVVVFLAYKVISKRKLFIGTLKIAISITQLWCEIVNFTPPKANKSDK